MKFSEGKTGPYLIAVKQDRETRGNFESEEENRGARKRSEHRGLQQTAQNSREQAHSQVSKVSGWPTDWKGLQSLLNPDN